MGANDGIFSDHPYDPLRQEVEQTVKVPSADAREMEAFLLSAPTFSDKQLETIAKTRQAINQWRTE